MFKCFFSYILFFSLLSSIYGCKLNDTLSIIKETINTNSKEELTVEIEQPKKPEENLKPIVKNQEEKVLDEELTIALVQPMIKKKKLEDTIVIEKSEKIGLLLPLTGSRASLGKSLVNSVRVYTDNVEKKIDFRVYDTRSTNIGAQESFKKALNDGINIYIGPIFSDETIAIKDLAENKDVLIYSLSTDQSIVSKNILISGFSVEDEVSCILQKIKSEGNLRLGIIHNNDKYGNLLKKVTANLIKNFSEWSLTSLEISDSLELDKDLKKFSFFEEGKNLLESEIEKIKLADINSVEKELKIKKLEKLETFGEKPFDSLIIGESGNDLIEILALLAFYDINSSNTLIFGTNIWDGIEKSKEDVIDDTYYATSLLLNKNDYQEIFLDIFDFKPSNLNLIINDIIDYIISEQNSDLRSEVFHGKFSSFKATSNGHMKRKIFINKFSDGKVKLDFECAITDL